MRYVWLAILAVSAAPLVLVGFVMNPFFVLLAGIQWWLDWMTRLRPYRWLIALDGVVFAFSLAVYIARY